MIRELGQGISIEILIAEKVNLVEKLLGSHQFERIPNFLKSQKLDLYQILKLIAVCYLNHYLSLFFTILNILRILQILKA